MKNVQVYLNFDGNTEEAFNFYKSVFGGEFSGLMRFKDVPNLPGKISDEDMEKIMHMSLPLTENNVLMGTDSLESMGQKLHQGNNVYIMIEGESREQADEYFQKLSEGGKVEMPMQDQFWGDYFGSLTDKFGVQWMIIHSKSQSHE